MINVLFPGLQSSIQDTTPRNGIEFGISNGGTADSRAASLGNIILGQPVGCPVLEMVRSPVKFKFLEACSIVITGFGLDWKLNEDQKVEPWKAHHIPKNSTLMGRPTATGFRSYICVKGGFIADNFDNTFSTDLRLGLGGCRRALKKEDVLRVNTLDSAGNPTIPAIHPQPQPTAGETKFTSAHWRISHDLTAYASKKTIRIMPGPQIDWFDHTTLQRCIKSSWKIDPKSDRMGIRLKNDFPLPRLSKELLSTVVIPGTIQMTPSGPIILFVDAQTTGGYPRIGQVCAVDLPTLAQKAPGDEILFEWITPEQAIRLQDEAQREMQQITSAILLH